MSVHQTILSIGPCSFARYVIRKSAVKVTRPSLILATSDTNAVGLAAMAPAKVGAA